MKNKFFVSSHLIIEIAVLLASILLIIFPVNGKDYRIHYTGGLNYVRARVVEVISESLEESTLGTGNFLGSQKLRVRFTDGREVELSNYLTDSHNIRVRVGQSVIICADEPEGIEPYYSVYSYDRTLPIILLIAGFFLLLVLVGSRKGFDAFAAILFTLVFILCVALPLIYNGHSPTLVGLVTVLLSTAVTLLLMHGITKECALGIMTTLIGELCACVLFAVFSSLLHLTGFQTDDAESLILVSYRTGLDIKTLLIAGMMISSLGAVMDVSVSILSALREIAAAGDKMSRSELFSSGMSMGKDLIVTMSNTLIFAFAGGALTSMLVLYSYDVQPNQLLNSDFLALELSQGLCSTAAVILTVPAASLIGATFFASRKSKRAK